MQILFCTPRRLTMSTTGSCGYGSVSMGIPTYYILEHLLRNQQKSNGKAFTCHTHISMTLYFLWKTLNRPKEMNAVSTKVLLRFFSSSLHFCLIHIFSSDTQACFAVITSYGMECFALVTSHNMPSNMLCTPLYP